jgi:hypothetical protein
VNGVMNLRVLQQEGNFLTSWVANSFSRTLLHVVSQSVSLVSAFEEIFCTREVVYTGSHSHYLLHFFPNMALFI